MKTIRELKIMILLNLKCFFANRLAVGTLVAVTMVFLMISTSLVREYEKKTSLPIGVVDLDQSEFSKEMVEDLKKTKGFNVYEWSEKDLQKALEEEKLYAYFVIEQGYEEKVKANQAEKVVSMYYLTNYNFVSILSDVFAKSTMDKVMLYRADALYKKSVEKYEIVEDKEYIPYVEGNSLSNENGFFDYEYYKVTDGTASDAVETKNSILATEIYLGVVTLFTSFFGMFFVLCQRRGKEIKKRLRICLIRAGVIRTANIITVFIGQGVVSIVLSIYITYILRLDFIKDWKNVFTSLCMLGAVVIVLYVTLSKLVRSETLYQLAGVLLLFLFGGLSIMASIGQITVPILDEFAKNIPNYWFITDIIDIILAG